MLKKVQTQQNGSVMLRKPRRPRLNKSPQVAVAKPAFDCRLPGHQRPQMYSALKDKHASAYFSKTPVIKCLIKLTRRVSKRKADSEISEIVKYVRRTLTEENKVQNSQLFPLHSKEKEKPMKTIVIPPSLQKELTPTERTKTAILRGFKSGRQEQKLRLRSESNHEPIKFLNPLQSQRSPKLRSIKSSTFLSHQKFVNYLQEQKKRLCSTIENE